MAKVAKDTALSEITLRRYERADSFSGRDLVRKLTLSLGLLQPGDSRDVVVDILFILISTRDALTSEEINQMVIELRQEQRLPQVGIAPSNIRRQLKRLRDLHLVEKIANTYRITEDAPLSEIFSERIERFIISPILERVREFCGRIDKEFPDPYGPK
jgi:DNA-binding transcriptional ArsR family regulator